MLHAIAYAWNHPISGLCIVTTMPIRSAINRTYSAVFLAWPSVFGLTIEVDEQDGHIMLRFPITQAMRRKMARKGFHLWNPNHSTK